MEHHANNLAADRLERMERESRRRRWDSAICSAMRELEIESVGSTTDSGMTRLAERLVGLERETYQLRKEYNRLSRRVEALQRRNDFWTVGAGLISAMALWIVLGITLQTVSPMILGPRDSVRGSDTGQEIRSRLTRSLVP